MILISIFVAFALIFTYVLVTIVAFNNQVEKTEAVDIELSRRFKIKLLVSGIVSGMLFGIIFFDLQGFSAAIIMAFFWSTILGLGLLRLASSTISILENRYHQQE